MALQHVTGETLQVGMFDPGNGLEGQSGSKSAGGELKTYRDKDGAICSLYAVDADESDVQFEGLLKKAGYTAKDVGDELTGVSGVTVPAGGKLLVEEWTEVYQSDEVVKVQGRAHIYIVAATQST